jgi:hypothetical protein
MNKKELKKSLRELHRMNIMISKDLDYYNKEIDSFFNSSAQRENPNVSDNETKERKCEHYKNKCGAWNFECPYIDNDEVECW